MLLKISKKMATLITGDEPEAATILEKIAERTEAEHLDKAGAVVIDASDGEVEFLRRMAAARMAILDAALLEATTDEELKPHFGEHSAWRALVRQIAPVYR